MFFSIDPHGDVAIYQQIVHQVKLAVADGTLTGGQMLPSVRQLSKQLTLNPNTVARAYRDLQSQQIIQPVRGRGVVVREDAVAACTDARDEIVAAALRQAIARGRAGGMSRQNIRDLFETELASSSPEGGARVPAGAGEEDDAGPSAPRPASETF